MAANVLSTNLDYASLSAAVRRERPAVLVVQEVDAPWLAALEPLRAEWPHEISDARDDNFGIGLFSALPIRDARLIAFGPDELPAIVATIAVGERALTIVVLHAVPPRSHYHFVLRGMQLEGAAAVVRDAGPAILIGDFNTTPWSPTFTDLVADGRLLDGRRGFGLQPTWHTAVPPLLIPIDHCLHTPDVRVVSFRAGSPNGSDHYPLVVDVVPLR
jgi:endonuclease/exonuclease/phosphatase (EEP) superfamily protein YafD